MMSDPKESSHGGRWVWRSLAALLAGLIAAAPAAALAQQNGESGGGESETAGEDDSSTASEPTVEPQGEVEAEKPAETTRADGPTERERKLEKALDRQLKSGQNEIHIYQLVEEITDEVIADIRDLRIGAISPAAMRRLGLTRNLSQQFGEFVEATLVNAIANHTDVRVKRCVACQSLRSRIDEGDWVVSLGLTRQKQLREEAERLGVKTFLDARFSYFPQANIVAMQVEFIRAEDGAVMWTETYRSDSTTAAILRSGDRVKSRKERVEELERKLEERPYFGHTFYLGVSHIPYDSPEGGITGAALGYRLYEEFGATRRWRYGFSLEGFGNFSSNPLMGGFVGATLQYDLLAPDLNKPELRTGPVVSGFFAGQEGNSAAIEWGLDVILQFRLGAGVSAMYFIPTTFAGADLGGFGYKARISFNW